MWVRVVTLLCLVLASFALPTFRRISDQSGYYTVSSSVESESGFVAELTFVGEKSSAAGAPISPLLFEVILRSNDVARVRIIDPNASRFEVPDVLLNPNQAQGKRGSTSYVIQISDAGQPFTFTIQRASTQEVIFNGYDLLFFDQHLHLSTGLPEDPYVYGLGERVVPLRLEVPYTYTIFATDQMTPDLKPVYGSHPFYMEMREGGLAHGVFLLNSHAMDVSISHGSLTYDVVGGIFDLFFMVGPTPDQVAKQYHGLIGFPALQPYWSLGWHQCRWGYETIDQVREVVDEYRANGIPLEAMWIDIDHMDNYKDFTLDPVRFPQQEVREFVDHLHNNNQRLVLIVDPGIKAEPGFSTYEKGLEKDIYVKSVDGTKPYIGKVWPGLVTYPDFTHPDTGAYWTEEIASFYNIIEFDGLWVDMNELANFCDGRCILRKEDEAHPNCACEEVSVGSERYNNPPYVPGALTAARPCRTDKVKGLDCGSIDMGARYHAGLEYNLHSMYGFYEAKATAEAITKLTGERPFVLSRSTFPGSGRVSGHWLGDNVSTWKALKDSIAGMIAMNLFGIPVIGADVCGFGGVTTEELCLRWQQLGAFYPFARNHNILGSPSQEPYVFGPSVVTATKQALTVRYELNAHYYTQLYRTHVSGGTLIRGLFQEAPCNRDVWAEDSQFLVGPSVMVSPVLCQGCTTVNAYFLANSTWYDYYDGHIVSRRDKQNACGGHRVTLQGAKDKANVHVRGGHIVPTQQAELTTTHTRNNPFRLIVALEQDFHAEGEIFWDDGISAPTDTHYKYSHVTFRAFASQLSMANVTINITSTVLHNAFQEDGHIGSIVLYGSPCHQPKVVANGQPVEIVYDENEVSKSQMLEIPVDHPMLEPLTVSVTCPLAIPELIAQRRI
eukprot:TRINITY_DN4693_c0_g1::TRINITY_DN4693_c0_g1_i1::g.19641::m.19641 TRINITY_DN4693_c0_g1::TRINITY_DN4693_c0_g1_i1::g.19641  ORF type:complete len:905 (-),score=248.75,sp/O04893/AGLU_SPIOL/39.78/0.0,Glyco_hydro_31/PF01055.21/7.3e-152,Gal_mutarotas_2/PF13802.1/1.6e-09,Gal_mutarotas_2/PF13802.1/8e+03 TRINITY_DN4693_c0_g1_i1:394-3075(-)